jgi:hypothetical protein
MEHKIATPKKTINSLKFIEQTGLSILVRDGEWFISGECTKEEALAALDNHDATLPELTIAEKLALVGLSVEELKAALA